MNITQPINLPANLSPVTGSANNINSLITVILTPVSGCSSLVNVSKIMLDAIDTAKGSKVNINFSISFTASASTAIFDISVPFTGLFTDALEANGVVNVTSGASGGGLTSLVSRTGFNTIRVTLGLGGSSGTYTANLVFSYLVN